jgi:hypothetical protein
MLVVFVVEGDGWRDSSWLHCKGTVVVNMLLDARHYDGHWPRFGGIAMVYIGDGGYTAFGSTAVVHTCSYFGGQLRTV